MPSDDRWLTLDELAHLSKEHVSDHKDPRWPYVGLEHMAQGSPFLVDTAPSSASVSTNCVFEPGDILFGKLRPRLRKSLQVDFSGYCSTDILVLRAREGFCPRYVAKVFQSDKVFEAAVQTSVGTRMPRTSWEDLKKLSVFVPPLPEQRRIAEILDAADEAIRQSERVIAKLREVKKGLLHDLLTRGLDAEGNLRDPEAHPEQFKDSALGRIPREWEVGSLSQYADVVGGKRLPSGHSYADNPTGYRYLRVTDFYERVVDYASLEHLHADTFNALQNWEIHDGDVFLSIAGSIGFAGAFRPPASDRTVLTENAARIIPTWQFVPEFLALYMNGQGVQRQIEAQKGTGGGVPKLALFRIRNLQVACPPLEEQKRISDVLAAHGSRIRAEQATLDKLRQVKRGLMDDLLTGRVRV